MGMTVITNLSELEANIVQLAEQAARGMSAAMRKHAILIRDLARDYAPVKSGFLEENIDYRTYKTGRRNAYVVFVDIDAERERYSSVTGTDYSDTLGAYAFLMEEGLRPYGSGRYKLGKRSAAKRAGGKRVGGKFLARAIKDGTKTLMPDMLDAVKRVTGGTRRYNGGDEE